MSGAVLQSTSGEIAMLTLSNPGRLNAMTRAMWRTLTDAFDAIAAEPADTAPRCVLVRGEGDAFCAGGDISQYPSFRFDAAQLRQFHEVEVWGALQAMLDCPVPVVAQIDGPCMGAGLEIASACDIRLASHAARFGAPIAKLGFPMAPREAALVHGAVGDALARDMLLTAGVHDAARMECSGFLLQTFEVGELADAATAYAQRIARLAPQAARANKRGLSMFSRAAAPVPLAQSATDSIAQWLAQAYDYADSDEHREGIAAFLERRTPHFGDTP